MINNPRKMYIPFASYTCLQFDGIDLDTFPIFFFIQETLVEGLQKSSRKTMYRESTVYKDEDTVDV